MHQVLTRVMLCFGFALTCGIVHFIRGQTLDQSKELMNEMLTNYDRRHRPIYNQSSALQVSFLILKLKIKLNDWLLADTH